MNCQSRCPLTGQLHCGMDTQDYYFLSIPRLSTTLYIDYYNRLERARRPARAATAAKGRMAFVLNEPDVFCTTFDVLFRVRLPEEAAATVTCAPAGTEPPDNEDEFAAATAFPLLSSACIVALKAPVKPVMANLRQEKKGESASATDISQRRPFSSLLSRGVRLVLRGRMQTNEVIVAGRAQCSCNSWYW
jgi:hypothetical protein